MLKGLGGNKQVSPGGSCHSFRWSLVVISFQTSCLCLWSRTFDQEGGYLFPATPNPQAECGTRVSKIILSQRGTVAGCGCGCGRQSWWQIVEHRPVLVLYSLPTFPAWDIFPEYSSSGCSQNWGSLAFASLGQSDLTFPCLCVGFHRGVGGCSLCLYF